MYPTSTRCIRAHDDEVQLYAFDILAFNGDDLRPLPLSMPKAHLSRLLARRPDGIFLSDFEQGEIGPDLFRAPCNMDLEGLVSKRRDRPYRGGRREHWVKVKNPSHPAMHRVERETLSSAVATCAQKVERYPAGAQSPNSHTARKRRCYVTL